MSIARQRNIGAYIYPQYAAITTTVDSEVNGAYIDRLNIGNSVGMPLSCQVVIAYSAASIANAETVTISGNLQDATSSGGAGVADFGTALGATVVATGDGVITTATGVVTFDIDLSGAREFVRPQFTVATSGSATCTTAVTVVFGGFDKLGQ